MVEVAFKSECFLGEGPVWDDKTKTLFWVDILGGHIHEFSPDTETCKTLDIGQMIGAVAICNDGDFLVALKNGLGIINRKSGKLSLFAHPESHLLENRLNDGKCDPAGRFWIGSMAINEQPNAGSLYMLDLNNDITLKIDNTTISNGLAWSLDNKTFYFIDTPTMTVVAYDFELSTGNIANKRTVIVIDEKDGYPDGMTIDNEGMLWIGHWNGWQVTRWDPVKGEKLFALPLPVANVTSCTFGGSNFGDLYITTAKKGLTEDELKQQPLAGNLFVWKNTGYAGMAAVEYKKHDSIG
jgi:sugar lactone lactonase YvrE